MKNNTIILAGAALLLVGGVLIYMTSAPKAPGQLDGFAQCLKDTGTKFFGAFWCPHCQSQKKLFGSSAKLLPYTECSTPDGNGQMAVCKANGIQNYPTWVFPDGSTTTGEVTLATLATKSSCQLPTPQK